MSPQKTQKDKGGDRASHKRFALFVLVVAKKSD
jgi:hypothetical protein